MKNIFQRKGTLGTLRLALWRYKLSAHSPPTHCCVMCFKLHPEHLGFDGGDTFPMINNDETNNKNLFRRRYKGLRRTAPKEPCRAPTQRTCARACVCICVRVCECESPVCTWAAWAPHHTVRPGELTATATHSTGCEKEETKIFAFCIWWIASSPDGFVHRQKFFFSFFLGLFD